MSRQSLRITSTVSMQVKTWKYRNISCNTTQYHTIQGNITIWQYGIISRQFESYCCSTDAICSFGANNTTVQCTLSQFKPHRNNHLMINKFIPNLTPDPETLLPNTTILLLQPYSSFVKEFFLSIIIKVIGLNSFLWWGYICIYFPWDFRPLD